MTTNPKVSDEVRLYFEKIYSISTVDRFKGPGRDYTSTLDQIRWDAFQLGYRVSKEGLV